MAKRRDKNHAEIRDALRAAGLFVYDSGSIGGGYPDLVVVRLEDGKVWLVEVKADDTPLKPAQYQFILKLVSPAYRIFHAMDQAVKAILED